MRRPYEYRIEDGADEGYIVLITLMEETEPTVVMVLSKLTPRL
jgi:hypothetical protein